MYLCFGHLIITFTKKMWSLENFKIWQGDWGKSIYIYVINQPLIYFNIVLKIQLPERSDACVRDVAHMPAQYRHTSVTLSSHFVAFVTVSCLNRSVDGCRASRQMSRFKVCPVHTLWVPQHSGQLAVIHLLGLAVCLHWHRYVQSQYHHSCHFHSSGVDNPLLYCPHHQHAWWWSWNGRGTPTIGLVCLIGSLGSRNIWDPCGQLLGWICILVACPSISLMLWAWRLSPACAFCNVAKHY